MIENQDSLCNYCALHILLMRVMVVVLVPASETIGFSLLCMEGRHELFDDTSCKLLFFA